jgi:hypothetical protein
MAKILDNTKSRLRNDSAERIRVEKTMSQMNMTPSEQQSMEIAASALAMWRHYFTKMGAQMVFGRVASTRTWQSQ